MKRKKKKPIFMGKLKSPASERRDKLMIPKCEHSALVFTDAASRVLVFTLSSEAFSLDLVHSLSLRTRPLWSFPPDLLPSTPFCPKFLWIEALVLLVLSCPQGPTLPHPALLVWQRLISDEQMHLILKNDRFENFSTDFSWNFTSHLEF